MDEEEVYEKFAVAVRRQYQLVSFIGSLDVDQAQSFYCILGRDDLAEEHLRMFGVPASEALPLPKGERCPQKDWPTLVNTKDCEPFKIGRYEVTDEQRNRTGAERAARVLRDVPKELLDSETQLAEIAKWAAETDYGVTNK